MKEEFKSLHRYFIWSDRMRVHFDQSLSHPDSEEKIAAFEQSMYMALWYGSFYTLIVGWRELKRDLKLECPEIDSLLKSPNVKLLYEYRNGVFHFQREYNSKKFETLYKKGKDFPTWIRNLREAFSKYFLKEFALSK